MDSSLRECITNDKELRQWFQLVLQLSAYCPLERGQKYFLWIVLNEHAVYVKPARVLTATAITAPLKIIKWYIDQMQECSKRGETILRVQSTV